MSMSLSFAASLTIILLPLLLLLVSALLFTPTADCGKDVGRNDDDDNGNDEGGADIVAAVAWHELHEQFFIICTRFFN